MTKGAGKPELNGGHRRLRIIAVNSGIDLLGKRNDLMFQDRHPLCASGQRFCHLQTGSRSTIYSFTSSVMGWSYVQALRYTQKTPYIAAMLFVSIFADC